MHCDENDNTISAHIGTRVRKNHTSIRGAFETIGGNPAFTISEDKIQKNISFNFFKKTEYEPRINLNTKVALVKAMWAMGNFDSNEEVKEKMLENMASEIT